MAINSRTFRLFLIFIFLLAAAPCFTHGVEYFKFEIAPTKMKDILDKAKFISFFSADTKTFREGVAEVDGDGCGRSVM